MSIRITAWTRVIAATVLLTFCSPFAQAQVNFNGPQPGDVYREYSRTMMPSTGESWRVTDPNVRLDWYPQAAPFLPNPSVSLTIGDLQNAIRAEVVISMWGGHVGTTGKKIRFNGHSWIAIPELNQQNGIPAGHNGQCYLSEPTVVLPIPLSHLAQGTNNFQGECAGQTCYGFGWGQFGMYGLMVRVYYDPAAKSHPTGMITSPAPKATVAENPTISTSVSGSVDRVDIVASYTGYDTDGDGIPTGYHYDYQPVTSGDATMTIRNHVGTSTSAPFQVTWNTAWLPDQTAGGIKLMARIRDNSGIWYCSPEVPDLSIGRSGFSVKLFSPTNVPERAWAHGDLAVVTFPVTIPSVADATAAIYHNRTWNGLDSVREPGETHYRRLNSWEDVDYGGNHFFSYDVRTVPVSALQAGTNTFTFYTQTIKHHGMEFLWPGPAVEIKYVGNYSSPVPLSTDLASPATGTTNQVISPVLTWHPTPGGTSYQLQVSTDPTFASTAFDQSNIADTSRQVGALSSLTKYYWRVRANGPGGAGPYSQNWDFTTLLAAPSLVSPANSSSSVPMPVVLRWQRSPGATSYKLQLSADPTFATGLVVNDSTITDTTFQVNGLSVATLYFWHVKAMVSGGQFSLPWSFTTIVGPAATPVLVSPVNGTQGLAVASIDFSWQSAQWATTYRLQVSTDPAFASGIAFDDSTIAGTSRSVTTLQTDRSYYWRVLAKGPGGQGGFSNPWSFETIRTIPLAVSLVYPANGAAGLPTLGLTFRWNRTGSATHYGFQLGTDSTFASGLFKNDTALTDTNRLINGLQTGTRYYWRVRARNSAGWGAYSPTWFMSTLTPLPGQVALVGPPSGSLATADSAIFAWRGPTPSATRYWYEIALDSLFTSFRSIDSTLTDTARVFKPLLNGQRYYWRVRGWNPGGWGPFSQTWTIQVIISSIAGRPDVPAAYALEQNHPNPFNPSTKIGFALPREGHAKLEIYNMLGQKVATVLDERREPGYHTVTFDASSLPSGVYLYRLATSGGAFVRKMILMK